MEEEPSVPPLTEAYKRMKVERVNEAIQKVREEAGQRGGYKKREKMLDPERQTKHKEDPREKVAREEREETMQTQKDFEALG